VKVDLELVGSESAINRLGHTAATIRALPSGNPLIFDIMEESEQRLFESWHGKYVDTGRTMASLTERHHPDAIREMHGPVVRFGTRVKYARYLREGGRSAVLRVDNSDIAKMTAAYAEQIMVVSSFATRLGSSRVGRFPSHFTSRVR
jgi:hypothetical protein